MSLAFTIPGEPHAWERAQQHGRRKFNSSEMTAAKQTIAQYADLAIRQQKAKLQYPSVSKFWVDCCFCIGTNRRANPDIDNLAKLLLDALKGIVWQDDRQVIGLSARKVFGLPACTDVVISLQSELNIV